MNSAKAQAAYFPQHPPGENTMTTNIERAIEILEDEHDPLVGVIDAPSLVYSLNDAGLLMPGLPAPMQQWETERTGGTPESRWYGYADDGNDDGSEMYSPHRYIDSYPGEVWLDGHVSLSPEDTRAYALALLAAAEYAEKEK